MLNKICCDLRTSKKLKELRIEAETPFYWRHDIHNDKYFVTSEQLFREEHIIAKTYTLETILEMLPQKIKIGSIEYHFDLEHCEICYETWDSDNNDVVYVTDRYNGVNSGDNLATTATRLLIKLKQDKII